MKTAVPSPRPYLLNDAGGTCAVKEFSLVGGQLTLVPAGDQLMTGTYQLVYRCPDHGTFDIKRPVASNGTTWSLLEHLSPEDDCDVCYPESCA